MPEKCEKTAIMTFWDYEGSQAPHRIGVEMMKHAYIEEQSDYWLASTLTTHMNSLEMTKWPPVVQRMIEGQIVAIENEQAKRANIRHTQAQAAAQGLTIECVDISFVNRD